MKCFAISTFGALTTLFVLAGSVRAAALPPALPLTNGILSLTNVPLDLIPKYFQMMDKCNAKDDTPITVLYEGGEEVTHKFEDCIPRKLDDEHPFQMPVFCKGVTCKIYRTDDCTGDALPVSVPVLPGLAVFNPFDAWQFLAGSTKCSKL